MRDKICILIQTNDDYDWLWKGIFLSWKLNWDAVIEWAEQTQASLPYLAAVLRDNDSQ